MDVTKTPASIAAITAAMARVPRIIFALVEIAKQLDCLYENCSEKMKNVSDSKRMLTLMLLGLTVGSIEDQHGYLASFFSR